MSDGAEGPRVRLDASLFVVVLTLGLIGAVLLGHQPKPDWQRALIYHDARRGVTCYVFPQGVSCLPDANIYTAR